MVSAFLLVSVLFFYAFLSVPSVHAFEAVGAQISQVGDTLPVHHASTIGCCSFTSREQASRVVESERFVLMHAAVIPSIIIRTHFGSPAIVPPILHRWHAPPPLVGTVIMRE
ncbi:hypothetical protein HYV72_01045 [Candidatus Uhrbacteria bacterium]|nr:hypothetical protein [Candidatus Uhrbacteria bacterium]